MMTTNSQCEEGFIEKLRALASKESVSILSCLVAHRPAPVPVHALSEELGIERSKTSKYLARLRNARLVGMQSRKRGYLPDTKEIKAVIGETNYTRIIQDLRTKNEDTPGQSQG
jgi:DNA-binding transcriptional ArsR family regulator